MSKLRIRVLGPIAAEIAGVPVRLSKARHREIVGILVVAHGRTVSTDVLVDELWDDPPAGAVGSIRTFIGELRRLLEPERAPRTPPAILVTDGDGYAIRVGTSAVDLWRAEQAVQDAAGTGPETSESLLSAALAEWRGTAFEEFRARSWATNERARIAELRASIVERLASTHLALGRPDAVVELLGAHVDEHPWREEGWRLLALALYRSMRQTEALAVLARARATFVDSLGLDLGERLSVLERDILLHNPALDAPDGGSILMRAATVHSQGGARAQLESVTALLPLLAVSGSVAVAAEQRMDAIAAAEQFGDPQLTARVIGGFDVPAIWTRSDDARRSEAIVAAAIRTLAALPAGTSDRARARLLSIVAMESRGTADHLAEAIEAEHIARRVGDASLLCFALSARFLQSFETSGQAGSRESLGAEIIAAATAAELPTFEIEGRLIRMQALCALDDIPAAAAEADLVDALAASLNRPLASVFTAWFRWTFAGGARPPRGTEMPGFRIGLNELAELTEAVRSGAELPEGPFGPYEPWARPLVLARAGRPDAAVAVLDALPDPPQDLMLEVAWFLTGLAAVATRHPNAARRSYLALRPAAGERAGGSGAIDLGPISPLLHDLAQVWEAEAPGRSTDRPGAFASLTRRFD